MKKITTYLLILILALILIGCGSKKIQTINTYNRQTITKIGNKESVMIRPIADKFLNDQVNNVIIKNNVFTHAYGSQFADILKDSYIKNGYKYIVTGNVLKNYDDIDSVILEARNNNSRYAVISHINLGKFDIKDHVSANIGKSLIPLAGAFVEKSATMHMSLTIKMIMYDLKSNKLIISKEYSEEKSSDYKYTNSNIAEQIAKTRFNLYAELVINALSAYWDDYSVYN